MSRGTLEVSVIRGCHVSGRKSVAVTLTMTVETLVAVHPNEAG